GRELGDGRVVHLAVGASGQLTEAVDADRSGWQAEAVGDEPPKRRVVGLVAARSVHHRDGELVVPAYAARLDAVPGEFRFDLVRVDSQPEDLREPALPPDDRVEAVLAAPGEVAGAQLGDGASARTTGGAFRIAGHDVGPGVDELADLRVQAVDRLQPEGPARDGPADRVWVTFGELGRQVRHSRGGLGL